MKNPDARASSRKKILLWLSPLFVLAVLAITYVVIQRRRHAQQIREYEANEPLWEPLFSGRFERPVLRGVAQSCNAAAKQRAALAWIDFAPWTAEDFSNDLGKLDAAPSKKAQAIIDRNAKAVERLRRSVTCSWSWSADAEKHRLYAFEDAVPFHLAALKMLLAQTTDSPDSCLTTATDAMHLAQDRAAGSGMVGAMYTVAVSKLVADAIERCAQHASAAAKKRTCADLDMLTRHRIHVGHAFLFETFFFYDSFMVDALDGTATLLPTDGYELEEWMKANGAIANARALADAAPKWLELKVIDDDDDVARVATIQDELTRAATPNVLEGVDLVAYAERLTETGANLERATALCR